MHEFFDHSPFLRDRIKYPRLINTRSITRPFVHLVISQCFIVYTIRTDTQCHNTLWITVYHFIIILSLIDSCCQQPRPLCDPRCLSPLWNPSSSVFNKLSCVRFASSSVSTQLSQSKSHKHTADIYRLVFPWARCCHPSCS